MGWSALRWWLGCLWVIAWVSMVRGQDAPTAHVGTYYRAMVNPAAGLACPCHFVPRDKLPDGLAIVESGNGFELFGLPTAVTASKAYSFYVEPASEKKPKIESYGVWTITLEVKEKARVYVTELGASEALPFGVLGHEYAVDLVPVVRNGNAAGVAACPATPTPETARAATSMGFTLPTDPASTLPLTAAKLTDVAGTLSTGKLPLQFVCGSWPGTGRVTIDTSEPQVKAAVDMMVKAGTSLKEFERVFGEYDRNPCKWEYNDCDWKYIALGGLEQSELAAQDSQTNGLVDLILRAPVDAVHSAIYLQARFLGAPASSTNNITSAVTNPTGTLTSTALSQIGSAVDYAVGLEQDWWHPGHRGQFTVGIIEAFGATSPVSAATVSTAYVMPSANTPECTTLLGKYPQLEAQYGFVRNGTVTTTMDTGTPPPTKTTASFCLVNTKAVQSTSASGTTTTVDGTGIADLVQSSADRTSLLLKYVAGVRLIERYHTGTSSHCAPTNVSRPEDGPCLRKIVDFTLGQDEAITGGRFHGMIFKSDILLPIKQTGVYFFGTAAIRLRGNTSALLEAPLILTPVPIASATNTGTSAVAFPSSSVAVVQRQQSDRDFYRIGLALNLDKVLTNLFKQ